MNHSSTFLASRRHAARGAVCLVLASCALGAAMAVEQASSGVDPGKKKSAQAPAAGNATACPPRQHRVQGECKDLAPTAPGAQTAGVRPPRVLCDETKGCVKGKQQPVPRVQDLERDRREPIPPVPPATGR